MDDGSCCPERYAAKATPGHPISSHSPAVKRHPVRRHCDDCLGTVPVVVLHDLVPWEIAAFGGIGLAFGFVFTAAVRVSGGLAFLITVITTYLPIYIIWNGFNHNGWDFPLLFFDTPEQFYGLGILFAVMVAAGGHAPQLWHDLLVFLKSRRKQPYFQSTS